MVIFVSNLIGAVLFDEVAQKLDQGFLQTTVKAVFGGWLVALMAWMVVASKDTTSKAFFIYALAFLIPASVLIHCIAGSSRRC